MGPSTSQFSPLSANCIKGAFAGHAPRSRTAGKPCLNSWPSESFEITNHCYFTLLSFGWFFTQQQITETKWYFSCWVVTSLMVSTVYNEIENRFTNKVTQPVHSASRTSLKNSFGTYKLCLPTILTCSFISEPKPA
jgi:hypothetical protein